MRSSTAHKPRITCQPDMPRAYRPDHDNGRAWHDAKAPDRFTVNGWRQVHKGGYVRFLGAKHFHNTLADWVGLWVFVELDDGWAVNVNVWPDEPWKDRRTMLCCTNEHDWLSQDRAAAENLSRARYNCACN